MTSRRLTLLRHGQAQPIDTCDEDFERSLTHRGAIEAEEMGKRLRLRSLVPDLILVSPSERTWATAEIIANFSECDAKQIQCARELYLASAESIWRLIQRLPAGAHHVLVCGHNPGLSHLASRLGPKPQNRDLPTAGLATAEWSGISWEQLTPETAQLCDLDDPESLADLWV